MLVKPKLKYSKEQKAHCTSFRPTCTKPHVVRSPYRFELKIVANMIRLQNVFS